MKLYYELEASLLPIGNPNDKAIWIQNCLHKKGLCLDVSQNGCNKILFDIIKNYPEKITNAQIYAVYANAIKNKNEKIYDHALIGSAITLSREDKVYIVELDHIGYQQIDFNSKKKSIKIHVKDFASIEEIEKSLIKEIVKNNPDKELINITSDYQNYIDILESFKMTDIKIEQDDEIEQDERD